MRFFDSDGQLGRLSTDNATLRRQPPNSALCFPLESLLLALNRTHVDYFSLDVEGFELDVLRSVPLGRLHIDVISVEFLHALEHAPEYNRLMTEHGYSLYATVRSMDYVFVKNHILKRKDKANNEFVTPRTPAVRRRTMATEAGRRNQWPQDDDKNVNIIYK